MQVAVFGNSEGAGYVSGWARESAVAVFGSAKLDLTRQDPAPDAELAAVAVFGEVKVVVPAGCRVRVSGFSLFGERRILIQPADGPELRPTAVALFGNVRVTEGAALPVSAQTPVAERPVFPF
jgi:predicted membrane protein